MPPVDAPNVNGARIFGFASGQVGCGPGSRRTSRRCVRPSKAGRVAALYVFDPDRTARLATPLDHRGAHVGKLPLLIVQGVLMTDLARAADFVLPGASYVEKEASYTNDRDASGHVARDHCPGRGMEDWQILVNLARRSACRSITPSAAHIRADIAARMPAVEELKGLPRLAFARPMSARTWLQASNPSERWKWEFLYQDLPPVKGSVDISSLPAPPGVIG